MTEIALIVRDQSGATSIEYGLIAALIAVAAIGGMSAFADSLIAMWEHVTTTLHAAEAAA